jgi:23S rRNA (cytosine1962-C5)-methyltransferase
MTTAHKPAPHVPEALPTVHLRPGEAERVQAGHPWIYEGSVAKVTKTPEDGGLVQVRDHRHRPMGFGFFNSKSRIRVRVISIERTAADKEFFVNRFRTALALRRRHLPGATSFRLVNAESDFLSGLIVDQYEDVLVLQITSLGMDVRRPSIVAALQEVLAPRAIVERSDTGSRKFEGLGEATGVLAGHPPGEVIARLNGLKFQVDLTAGHKTGLYLDQQTNYQQVAQYARGGRVLDCFCFAGGFGLHAARAEAAQVVMVDQSAEAVALAQRNAAANSLSDRCAYDTANVFDWLNAKTASAPGAGPAEQFDLVILDPPSFTRTRAAIPDALRGYKEIHLRALRLLKPGGVLATFCCSHHVDALMFQEAILAAAFDARVVLRRIATFSQGPDHPILPTIPETEYLKGFAFEIAR